jgi:hypothetical protein
MPALVLRGVCPVGLVLDHVGDDVRILAIALDEGHRWAGESAVCQRVDALARADFAERAPLGLGEFCASVEDESIEAALAPRLTLGIVVPDAGTPCAQRKEAG